MLFSNLSGTYYVPYAGFETCRRTTVKIRLYFKRLMFMQMFCKKKKKKGRHNFGSKWHFLLNI